MIIFYNPIDNQVMYLYPGNAARPDLTDKGLISIVIPGELERLGNRLARESRVVLDEDGNVTNLVPFPNPVQPLPRNLPRTRLDDLRDVLANDTITLPQIREMMRIERGL